MRSILLAAALIKGKITAKQAYEASNVGGDFSKATSEKVIEAVINTGAVAKPEILQ